MLYQTKVHNCLRSPMFAGNLQSPNAEGKSASLECGTLIKFAMSIDLETKVITEVRFNTNGCGYMVAAADNLAKRISCQSLTELHGLDNIILKAELGRDMGEIPHERLHCIETVLSAIKDCVADFRSRQVQEFVGEKAVICTCFGVSEEKIEEVIVSVDAHTVEAVGDVCRAGTGCGACQILISEIIDSTIK